MQDIELKSRQVIAQWRDAGYHLQPEYVSFAQLLQSAPSDASVIMRDRFPAARFIECDQNSSQVPLPHVTANVCITNTLLQARFLTARVNPSVTQSSTGYCCTLLQASIFSVTLVAQLQFQQRNRTNRRRLVSGAFASPWF